MQMQKQGWRRRQAQRAGARRSRTRDGWTQGLTIDQGMGCCCCRSTKMQEGGWHGEPAGAVGIPGQTGGLRT